MKNSSVAVIGSGIGGLSAAAALAHAGLDVTVLEAHIYPGGCAGTFRYQSHWFDAGATLAAGFGPGQPMQFLGRAAGIPSWPVRPTTLAMVVHLPDGTVVERWGDDRRWTTYAEVFPKSLPFWQWQETTATLLWDFALRLPEVRPRTLRTWGEAARIALSWMVERRPPPSLFVDLFTPLAHHLPADPRFRQFIDAQLLISAQATAQDVFALYGAAALDLPRSGVVEVAGGIGAIASVLAQSIQEHGGTVFYRQEVTHLRAGSKGWQIRTQRGLELSADVVIANVTPWALARLWQEAPSWFRKWTEKPPAGWGAFVLYVSLDAAKIPPDAPLHHQILRPGPLGEGNSVFVSLSPAWDTTRAPSGRRVATISTHTNYQHWWEFAMRDRVAYEAEKSRYQERILETAATALPWLPEAVRMVLPGTPLTFARFTRRPFGWVGGFPQVHLRASWPTVLAPHFWLVGDSVFPGQSIPATALAGLRVARAILRYLGRDLILRADPPQFDITMGIPHPIRQPVQSK